MTKLQFRVLYREFLFRMVDLELLSPEGDITELLGRFAGVLVFISSSLALGAMFFNGRRMTPEKLLNFLLGMEHTLIAMTMLVVGLFAVLSWDSAFPDRRDVLVLAPLPVRPRTLFLAKVAAVGTSLGLTVAALHVFSGIFWPLHFIPENASFLGYFRSVGAYWITMLAAGAFNFCCVLGVQGLAAQLPRRLFLRLSAWLQMGGFGLFVCLFLMEPPMATPAALAAPQNQRLLAWLPSYWFLGLFQSLNGSVVAASGPLARRAWAALAVAVLAAGLAFLLSYFRTLRKIVEEPDIAPGFRHLGWTPRFGNALETAVVLFSIRTLLRSRQHRVILAFYLGMGFAMAALLWIGETQQKGHFGVPKVDPLLHVNGAMLISTVVMLGFWVAGTRTVFSMPLDLRANWIFRVIPIGSAPQCLKASRRALLALAIIPVWLLTTAVFLSIWPWRPVAAHLVLFGLVGSIAADLFLHGFQKIPFTCSYLPGKSNLQLALSIFAPAMLGIGACVQAELAALHHPAMYAAMVAALAIAVGCARWRTVRKARDEEAVMQFEDVAPPTVQVLGLYRDGALVMEPELLGMPEPSGPGSPA